MHCVLLSRDVKVRERIKFYFIKNVFLNCHVLPFQTANITSRCPSNDAARRSFLLTSAEAGFPGNRLTTNLLLSTLDAHTHTHTYIQMHKRTRTQLLTTKLRKPQNFHRDIFHFTLFVRLFGLPRRRIDHSSHKEKRRLSALDKGSEKIPRSTNVYSLAAGICCLDYLLRDDRQKKNKKPNRESNVKEIVCKTKT